MNNTETLLMKQHRTAHSRLLQFMIGWHKGAGHNSFTEDQFTDEDFKAGFNAGRAAGREAHLKASAEYGSKLNEIKAQ